VAAGASRRTERDEDAALIGWLDAKMTAHAKKTKLPDKLVHAAEFEQHIEDMVRKTLTERILEEADLDKQVEDAVAKIKTPSVAALAKGIKASFKQQADREWRDHIEAEAKKRTTKDLNR
jgi:hypothetical protein